MFIVCIEYTTAFLPQYSIENFRGDRRKPVLVLYLRHQGVQTADGGTAHFRVRILVTYPANAFRFNQLLPGQCNVVCTGGQKRPTPHYNSCVREDALLEAHMRVCAAVLSKSPSFVEAGVLARVRLYQRHNSAAHSLEKFCDGFQFPTVSFSSTDNIKSCSVHTLADLSMHMMD